MERRELGWKIYNYPVSGEKHTKDEVGELHGMGCEEARRRRGVVEKYVRNTFLGKLVLDGRVKETGFKPVGAATRESGGR
jgi:hypothetical protein